MNKEEAILYMIDEIEKIERKRLATHLSSDANRQKKVSVDSILNKLKDVKLENENQ